MTVRSGTYAELKELGLLKTGMGQAALLLAKRMDQAGANDSSAGAAAAARELRMLMADMRDRPATGAVDPVDELRARRASRRRGA